MEIVKTDRYKIVEIKHGVYVKDILDYENVLVTTDIDKAHKFEFNEYGEHLTKAERACKGRLKKYTITHSLEEQ